MITRKGHEKKLMLSTGLAEATYGAGVAVGAGDYTLMKGYTTRPEMPDIFTDNAEEVHGAEIATDVEITEQRLKLPYESPKVQPHDLVALGALTIGDEETTVDPSAADAWRHYIKPVAVGTALKSIGGVYDPANRQETYKGLVGSTFNLSSEEVGHVALSCELMGSGERDDSASAIQSAVTEVLMRATDTKVYLNPSVIAATDIVAAANIVQDDANIDGAVPALTALGARVKSWAFNFSNNLDEQAGMGGEGFLQGLDFSGRTMDVELTLRYADETERDYYENLNALALEFNNRRLLAGVIGAGGTLYYGFVLRIPLVKLNVRPEPDGGTKDPYTITLGGTILDDGVNEMFDFTVFNGVEDYLT